jgi:hypothetical protein
MLLLSPHRRLPSLVLIPLQCMPFSITIAGTI